MPRFRSHGQLDDPFMEDGDPAFMGLDQQSEPVLLQAGTLQVAENVRINQGVISTRKGLRSVGAIENGKALVKFLDPVNNREDILIITPSQIYGSKATDISTDYADNDQVWSNIFHQWSDYSSIDQSLSAPFAESDDVFGIQAFDKVILFSGGRRPKIWDGQLGSTIVDLPEEPSITGDTFFACPNAPFGIHFANRIITPHYEDSPTSIAFSDIFDANNFSPINTFYANKGTSDITLGFAPFMENQLLVFNKESIHLINNVHALEGNSASYEISRQYGIAGKRAFAQNGSYTYFVSSEGNVQVLVPSSDPAKGLGVAISKVTLDQQPLSKPITPFIEKVNLDDIEKCIVKYHRNRVYFAFPMLDSTHNDCSAIAVYNSLTSVWESIDTFQDTNIKILDMETLGPDLYILSDNNVFIYDSEETDNGVPIVSRVRTRDYALQSRDVKKFVRGSLNYSSEGDSEMEIKVHTKAPDTSVISRQSASNGTTNTLSRFNIRQRGYSASVDVKNTGGRIDLKSVGIEAFVHSGRSANNYGN